MALEREAESKRKIRRHLLYLIVGKWLWYVCKGTVVSTLMFQLSVQIPQLGSWSSCDRRQLTLVNYGQCKVIQGTKIQEEILSKAAADTRSQDRMPVSLTKGCKNWWQLAIPELLLDTKHSDIQHTEFQLFFKHVTPRAIIFCSNTISHSFLCKKLNIALVSLMWTPEAFCSELK